MLFYVCMRVLCYPVRYESYIDYSKSLIVKFVRQCRQFYGNSFMSYNVHSLIHFPDHCKVHGSAETFSSFPFESYLGSLKRCVKSGRFQLQQIVKYILQEYEYTNRSSNPADYKCKYVHSNGPVLRSDVTF